MNLIVCYLIYNAKNILYVWKEYILLEIKTNIIVYYINFVHLLETDLNQYLINIK